TSVTSAGPSTAGSGTESGGGDTTAGGDGADGFIFDVGNMEGTAGESTGAGYDGPGSCRMSEIYGAAGAYPEYDDNAWDPFVGHQIAIMTSFGYSNTDAEVRIFDISGDPPTPNLEYAAPMYINSAWSKSTFGGGLFGITLDSYGNIFVAA